MAFNSNELGVIRTYVAITGEAPTQSEFEAAFEKSGMNALATELLQSRPQQSNQAFVEGLYQNLLGRAADEEGLQYWTSLLSASAGQNQLSKARVAAEFQNAAAANAADEPGLVDGTAGLTSVDGEFTDIVNPPPVTEPPEYEFSFDTSKGQSDVKGWTHTKSDETDEVSEENGADTYMSNTHKIYNVGMNAIDQGVGSISRDYTFRTENQLGDHGHYEAYFLSPILDNVVTNLGTTLTIEVIDRMAEANNKDAALSLVAIESFSFRLNGEQIVVGSDDILNATTYEELEAAIQTRINELAVDNDALDNVTVELGADFTRQQVDPDTLVTTGANVLGTQIVITATGSNVIERGGFSFGERSGVDRNVDPSGRQDTDVLGSESSLISTNLEFKNVGYGSQGGSVNVSGQSLSETGVQEFNVAAEKHALGLGVWLTELSSQPLKNRALNTLEVINLTGDADYFHVGEEQSAALNDQEGAVLAGKENAGITDVRFFNASQFNQNVKLNAEVTSNVIARDLNRVDGDNDAAADNVTYTYNLGGGNNDLFLSFSESVIAHEDAALSIVSGNGSDQIHLVIDNDGDAAPGNWYSNQKDQKNIAVNTGSGDDTVWTEGNGDATILTVAGDDTVYSDNSGSKYDNVAYALGTADADEFAALAQSIGTENGQIHGHWVFNTETGQEDVQDLLGGSGSPLPGTTGESGPYFLYGSKLTVTFSGASAAGAGLTNATAAAFDNGFEVTVDVPTESDFTATERHINQAIKNAINNDDVLNKMLVAIDGPNDTLIVRSLVDGIFDADDLNIRLEAGTLPAAGSEFDRVQTAWEDFNDNSGIADIANSDLNGQVDDVVDSANVDGHYEGLSTLDNAGNPTANSGTAVQGTLNGQTVTGTDSVEQSNNVINVGTGQDVIVLGTQADSNDTLVYTGYNNGENSVLNFAEAGVGIDFLHFQSYLTTTESASGSAQSTVRIGTNYVAEAGTAGANSVSIINFESGAGANDNETWANLTASDLVRALNGTEDYGIGGGDVLDAAKLAVNNDETDAANTDVVGDTLNHIVMVENADNDGEYKIFHLTSTLVDNASAGSFNTNAQLVGILDLGESLDEASPGAMDNVLV
ncbi:DUF4214 domain-containing protein [Marinobacter xestospongiae]|uniref:DUF4214 domain-containing protein n=1 Tax=Marinobacter xestospongiae TaxID=994319 RepID=A0ABU3W066_9GAMM|nr:DUF4214 domain-containing protein [Marinobacter xestospongiae]MDV2079928.1 DUF4214 domain-containing protein [Marinobacter xestospongiae]